MGNYLLIPLKKKKYQSIRLKRWRRMVEKLSFILSSSSSYIYKEGKCTVSTWITRQSNENHIGNVLLRVSIISFFYIIAMVAHHQILFRQKTVKKFEYYRLTYALVYTVERSLLIYFGFHFKVCLSLIENSTSISSLSRNNFYLGRRLIKTFK